MTEIAVPAIVPRVLVTALESLGLEAGVISVLFSPEILIGSLSYLVLKPLLKKSGLVDKRKGAYKNMMILYNVLMAVFSAACFIATTVPSDGTVAMAQGC